MSKLYLGNTELSINTDKVEGSFVEIENEKFYKISNYAKMPDFFMTIVSDSNHWMYLSSNGSLTAGRKNRNNALFPYYTVDKIHDYRNITGSKTYCIVEKNGKLFWWEPFTAEAEESYKTERNLYKSVYGNKIIFEDINHDLGIGFQYGWYNSEKFGWVKKSKLFNQNKEEVKVSILDGIQNILPHGVEYAFQNEYSNLLDAYKKNELLSKSKLGLYMLSSIPVDRAEPSEALKTTTVWSCGLPGSKILISQLQLKNFKQGLPLHEETDVRASRGAYLIHAQLELNTENEFSWYLVAEVNQDSAQVANLDLYLKNTKHLEKHLEEDIQAGTKRLAKIVASSDGMQSGNEELAGARHFSNTMFNIMRGGVFSDNYRVDKNDFQRYLHQTNKNLEQQFSEALKNLPGELLYNDLAAWGKQTENSDIERICYEYLPLTFSRRHGDPSRPWNQFSIETRNEDGSKKLNYEGNWRDIFQNWEALGLSFPEFIEGMILKFLNASTADGYNPYRVTRAGVDWEVSDPDDPWSYIGYWGDHQIIYLQKLFELSGKYHPGQLEDFLTKDFFVFADVPYRIKPFEEIEKNAKDTIDFDSAAHQKAESRFKKIGADGKLLQNENGDIFKANLSEKILVTLLSKLSNFVPEAGIWLNTQRPEWNDANNALVGNGVSMVTLYYIRRFLKFWEQEFSRLNNQTVLVSGEIYILFNEIYKVFSENTNLLKSGFNTAERYRFASLLGRAGTRYRNSIYTNSFSGKKHELSFIELKDFMSLALKYTDQSIAKNKRNDGLYHAYNLISIQDKTISIRYLYEMLEGQVAVLSSGYLSVQESLEVLDALKNSALFREDQYSYILYPNRRLPRFTEKNNIPVEAIKKSALLQKLLEEKEPSILTLDNTGKHHFNGAFRNANDVKLALEKLENSIYQPLIEKEKESVLKLFEDTFDHQSFTGRSGTFFAYEGLGSIYWHMVSKLLLAVQECYFTAHHAGANAEILGKIKDHYYEIKAGIGLYKSPELYGAFPTDAYSHTPANAGVKQPGLTGQVKEDVISRFGELGILVNNGQISVNTSLLNRNEFLSQKKYFSWFDLDGNENKISLEKNQLAFTLCQVPVIYTSGKTEKITIKFSNGIEQEIIGNRIPCELSSKIFARTGEIIQVNFYSGFTSG